MLEQARTVPGEPPGTAGSPTSTSRSTRATGAFRFFEVNPRIGRNNYYVTAAGANPMRFVVEDRGRGARGRRRSSSTREILYSIVPHRLLLRYVRDPAARGAGAPA